MGLCVGALVADRFGEGFALFSFFLVGVREWSRGRREIYVAPA